MSERERGITGGTVAGETPESPGAADAGVQEGTEAGPVTFPYSAAGAAFTAWFNERVRRLPNPTVHLGTKTATVRELHPDGRLEVSMHASAGEAEEMFVAFE